MFRIAKTLVKSIEQSVQDTFNYEGDGSLDGYFQSIPPNLLSTQLNNNTQNINNDNISGLRVLFVDDTQLQFQSFFDYIVGFNDLPLPIINDYNLPYPDYNTILSYLSNNEMVKINIWSAKGGVYRSIYVHTNTNNNNDTLHDVSLSSDITNPTISHLGIKVQWTPLISSTYTYHILGINITDGPATIAGLIPDDDYIIGCQDGLLVTGGNGLLQDIVRSRAGHSIILYVYNKSYDCVRPVNVNIGPEGRLGCNIGYGFLHRIPRAIPTNTNITEQIQPQLQQSNDTFIPNTIIPTTYNKKKIDKKSNNTNKNIDMNDYFTQGKDTSSIVKVDKNDIQPPPN